MTEYREFEGKNIEAALEEASKALQSPLDSIRYDIVSHGSTGIFGLVGAKKAKIRIKLNSDTPNNISSEIVSQVKERARDLVKDAFQLEGDHSQVGYNREDFEKATAVGINILERLAAFVCEDVKVQIETESQGDRILYKISCENSGLLIGKRGQTLEAMQYLVEKIVNKNCAKRIRVSVDVEGYLDNRRLNLKKLASKMAAKAKKINKPVTIGQMNAYDRRIVHLHLKDNQSVRTQSMGEGYYRKLVIFPKRIRKDKKTE